MSQPIPTVYYIDDNDDNRTILRLHCKVLGVMLTTFPSGAAFFQWVQHQSSIPQTDLIFDDGYHILQQIRAHPHVRQARVIATTADDSQFTVCQAAGFDGFIPKPWHPHTIRDQLRAILAGEDRWICDREDHA